MKSETDLFDISAEFLLNYLYPDRVDQWEVDQAGAFYRNYSQDVLAINEEERTVQLARDGFFHRLPQGLIARDDALKGKDFKAKNERLMRKAEQFRKLFKPVDTTFFRCRLHVEQQVSRLLNERLPFLLKRYFGYDIENEQNIYVRKVAPFLLYVRYLRADFHFIGDLLAGLMDCKVQLHTGRFTWEENIHDSCPSVRYELIMPNLSNEAYRALSEDIVPLQRFLQEWFIPFDTHFTVEIKSHEQPLVLGESLTLGYNMEIHQ